MGLRALGNPLASFIDYLAQTGTDASKERFTASGGTITQPGNGYTYHVFLSSDNFTISDEVSIEYLVVSGSGAGGRAQTGSGCGGGGGGGGVRTGSSTISSPQVITVGGGGVISPTPSNGTPSSVGSLLSTSGGGFGRSSNGNGGPGGSGGGGADGSSVGGFGINPTTPAPLGGPFPYTEGYPGGSGSGGSARGGGGGGGAGAAGSNGTITEGGNGGAGAPFPAYAYPIIQSAIPIPLQPTFGPAVGPTGLYGGGGGGGADDAFGPAGTGGPGGGGDGANGDNVAGSAGVENTGGGGGGGGYNIGLGGAGSKGIVIIRYLT